MALKDLFLNHGNMSYKCHCSAKYPKVSKLHFWNSRPEALVRLELCMCQWQLLLRPTRRMGKTPTTGGSELHPPIYCVCVHAHRHILKRISVDARADTLMQHTGTDAHAWKEWGHWVDNVQETIKVSKNNESNAYETFQGTSPPLQCIVSCFCNSYFKYLF